MVVVPTVESGVSTTDIACEVCLGQQIAGTVGVKVDISALLQRRRRGEEKEKQSNEQILVSF